MFPHAEALQELFPQPALEQNFVPFDGEAVRLPEKLAEPGIEYPAYHRERVFSA